MLRFFGGVFFIAVAVSTFIDVPSALFTTIAYSAGCLICLPFKFERNQERRVCLALYQALFLIGLFFACCCFMYMESKGYSYLLAPDIDYYFMPKTIAFLSLNDFNVAMSKNWDSYSFFSRYHEGYFSYLIPLAYLCDYLGADLYFSMQISTLLVYSLSGVVIFKLFTLNAFEIREASTYTLIICVFSVLFFYSSLMLRDIHVMYTYLLAIYFTFRKDFSLTQVLKIVSVVLVSCTLRIETGLFLFIMVPVYLMHSMQASRNKAMAVSLSFVVGLSGIVALALYSNEVSYVLTRSSEAYLEGDKGSGVIGTLQTLPVVGKPLSIIYNAIQPLPFWSKLNPGADNYRPEAYNIMTFPLSFSSLFNWVVICVIFVSVMSGGIRRKLVGVISKPLLYQLLIGLVFLYVQAAVVSQRRLMAFYVMYYILFFMILKVVTRKDKEILIFASIVGYFCIQLLAFIYLI